jgi:aminopeptidase N
MSREGPSLATHGYLEDHDFHNENIVSYQELAEKRMKQLAEVSYNLLVKLGEDESDGFSGILEVTFSLAAHNSDSIELDFQGKRIAEILVNGEPAQQVKFQGHKIIIDGSLFKAGETNSIRLHFRNTYVTNGAGLHFYTDPKDQKVYIYSHLEPFFCHRFFPCFD